MNLQLSLVTDERLPLVPDVEGGIWYQAGLVPHERQRQWFEALLAGTAWRSERRPMYEREVDVPRLMASHALDAPDLPAPLAEALAAAGRAQGLDAALADRLARATVAGAGELLRHSSESAARLRENVTSPGGTTAAALGVLMRGEGGLPGLMDEAVAAATKRGRELAGS